MNTLIKQLATMEDLAQGVGKVQQDRNGTTYELGKIATPYTVATVAELEAVDLGSFSLARVQADLGYTDYEYVPLDYTGIVVGAGSWVALSPRLHAIRMVDTVTGLEVTAQVTNGVLEVV